MRLVAEAVLSPRMLVTEARGCSPGAGPRISEAGAGHWQCTVHTHCPLTLLYLLLFNINILYVLPFIRESREYNFHKCIFRMTDAQCTMFCTACLWGAAVQWISNQIQSPRLVTARPYPRVMRGLSKGISKGKWLTIISRMQFALSVLSYIHGHIKISKFRNACKQNWLRIQHRTY